MKIKYILVVVGLAWAPVGSASELAERADTALQQVYSRYGGQEQAREQLVAEAEKKMRLCGLCHGSDGNSIKAGMPSLAGERAQYLLRRWYQIREGHGESETATKMVSRINESQMVALALYYAGVERVPIDFDVSMAARGKESFEQVCQRCHHADGRGDTGMPVIAGQQPEYLNRTLIQFRDHEGWRHGSKMIGTSRDLSPIEVTAVANYAASLNQ